MAFAAGEGAGERCTVGVERRHGRRGHDGDVELDQSLLDSRLFQRVEGESGHGHYADKELAYAYLKINDIENALKHALIEYDRRPHNIDVCETVAWVRYKKGEFAEANKLIDKALRTHSKNPVLLCRAGLIKIKAGEADKGKALIKQAVETNPFIDIELKKEASLYLASN